MSKPSVNFNQFCGAAPARAAHGFRSGPARPGPARRGPGATPPQHRGRMGEGEMRGDERKGVGGVGGGRCTAAPLARRCGCGRGTAILGRRLGCRCRSGTALPGRRCSCSRGTVFPGRRCCCRSGTGLQPLQRVCCSGHTFLIICYLIHFCSSRCACPWFARPPGDGGLQVGCLRPIGLAPLLSLRAASFATCDIQISADTACANNSSH